MGSLSLKKKHQPTVVCCSVQTKRITRAVTIGRIQSVRCTTVYMILAANRECGCDVD